VTGENALPTLDDIITITITIIVITIIHSITCHSITTFGVV